MKELILMKLSTAIIISTFLLLSCSVKGAHREHKVHNIVLYPDKHSWCKTLPIKQVISYPGCKSEEIDNNVCVGACFSYSIPHSEPSDPGEVIVPYCDSCQPSHTTWHHVTLDCTNDNTHETPAQFLKRVQIIKNCSCASCEMNRSPRFGDKNDEGDDLMTSQNEVPDLLDVLHSRSENNSFMSSEHSENVKMIVNHKINTLLQNILVKESKYDKQELMDQLDIIQRSERRLTAAQIKEFVESLTGEGVELDIPYLNEILAKAEKSKFYEDSAETKDIDAMQKILDITVDEPLTSSTSMEENMLNSYDHHEHDHIGQTESSSESRHNIKSTDKNSEHHSSGKHHHPHHHHIGEQISGHGRLTRGPHGALVIEPDSIHEKLDLNSHELKPNHVGALLSYDSHSTKKSDSLDD